MVHVRGLWFCPVITTIVVPVAGQDAERPQELIAAERLAAAGEWDQIIVSLTQLIQRLERPHVTHVPENC